jgi:hypothetical protein
VLESNVGQIIHDSGVFPQDSVCGFEKDIENV